MRPLTWLADALREAGLVVHETAGWTTRGCLGDFAPQGVLLHHTAAFATASDPHPSLDTVVAGRADRAGPLCHVLIDRNAECWVVAAGRTHHAGWAGASGPIPEGDGPALYVGIEVEYAGPSGRPTQYATSLQKANAIAAAARIVGRLGGDQRHVRAHKETSATGAVDPYSWDMISLRDSVRQTLEHPGW